MLGVAGFTSTCAHVGLHVADDVTTIVVGRLKGDAYAHHTRQLADGIQLAAEQLLGV